MEVNQDQGPLGGERKFEIAGGTVYQLMHHGWRKGEEEFRNRVWLSVNVDGASGLDKDDVAAFVATACNSHDQLIEALKAVVAYYAYAEFGPIAQAREALAAAGAAQ